MIKYKLNSIKQNILKRYIGVFCESVDENDAVKKLRNLLKLDDTWESSYKIEDFSNNVTISFTNSIDLIEIKFISTVGTSTGYSILINDKRIITKSDEDDIKNLIEFIDKDKIFKYDLLKINNLISNSTKEKEEKV